MTISVIIPALNEAHNIERVVKYLHHHGGSALAEIIVVDGISSDNTAQVAMESGASVYVASKPSRAVQMNLGAAHASGDILYFLHADSIPPSSFSSDILSSVELGIGLGCFRLKLDSPRKALKIQSWLSRFSGIMFRGGDASLFVTKPVFEELKGFCGKHKIMEEYDFILRGRKVTAFSVIQKDVMASARKHQQNSSIIANFANVLVFMMYFLGFSQPALVRTYQRLVKGTKYSV